MTVFPRQFRVALAGNPNAGKTTLFNGLTGARQHVGNYPGVTVERRQGHYLDDGVRYEVVDLPGTYSLSSLSLEERIAQRELLQGDQDVVVAVLDATALKRSLVFLAQLMLLDTKLVLCLNMADEARQAGQRLDLALLSQLLGMPIVETVGHRQQGLDQLKDAIAAATRTGGPTPRRVVLGERMDRALDEVQRAHAQIEPQARHARWTASRLLVGDALFCGLLSDHGGGAQVLEVAMQERAQIEAGTGRDISLYLTQCNYGFVSGLLQEVLVEQPRADWRAVSDLIDTVLAHRWLGLPFFLAAMYGTFWVAFSLGDIPMRWIEQGVDGLGTLVAARWPAEFHALLRSLVVDGIIGGVGGVVVFLPNIALLFLCLSLLEDTGYLSRAAFLVDRLMHRFGLHGKSFLPLVTGFGCSIPGIMATRTLENERDRLSTMLVLPLMSCGARLPIWMVLIPAFVAAKYRALALWGVYAAGILVAFALVFVLRRTLLRGEEAPFVMELPPTACRPCVRRRCARWSARGSICARQARSSWPFRC